MKKLRVELKNKVDLNDRERQYLKHGARLYCVKIWSGGENVVITDVTDAGKRGKVCPELSIDGRYIKNACPCLDLLYSHLHKLFELTTAKKLPEESLNFDERLNFYVREVESKRLLPLDLSIIKPLKMEPKKWTIPHVIRAIVNGQCKGLRCKYRHLDDTGQDFGEGEISDPINFARKIVEDPSGWWTNKNGNGAVTICCHSFDSNEFIPIIEKPKKEKKEAGPILKAETAGPKTTKQKSKELTFEEAREVLEKEGVKVEQTMTTPKKAWKSPRKVWQVFGRTNGLEDILHDLGCSRRRYRGMFSFWEGDLTIEIAKAIKEGGRLSFTGQQEKKEERAEKRAERFENYSDSSSKRSEMRFNAASQVSDLIPMGQPILVGHHSEKRHRRDLERIDTNMRKGIEENKKANYYQDRAAGIKYKLDKQKIDLGYLHNKIVENERQLKKVFKYGKNGYPDFESRVKELEEKLSYYKCQRNQIIEQQKEDGKIIPSPQTVDKDDLVKYRGSWYPVVRSNQKSITIGNWLGISTFTWRAPYDAISEIKKSS
ncbi:MAG: hypothetical protein COW00_01850 [Bdellovibrio sp. CG12_big_fil_rev_8_21_14_0_65_39_13]|nr:MAG: hypothetical protein COW78_09720 [Bdellovibrio sp. CG22_combo_CG10-13_8_21_14_all_39_27]PIQ62343.1 MAG: hypothetical protein COW00_01850 [Bdellovibrio sp. CG12_big_fil_rev_8_21_14_0_65_39_13]